jgi:hypothetical protein
MAGAALAAGDQDARSQQRTGGALDHPALPECAIETRAHRTNLPRA